MSSCTIADRSPSSASSRRANRGWSSLTKAASSCRREDFSAEQGKDFLRIEAAGDVPTSGYGLPWKNERIIGAARLAAVWHERWQPLGLYKIASVQTADGQLLYELRTPARCARRLGRYRPASEPSREPSAEQKIAALEHYVHDKGPLDRDGGEPLIDLRALAGGLPRPLRPAPRLAPSDSLPFAPSACGGSCCAT